MGIPESGCRGSLSCSIRYPLLLSRSIHEAIVRKDHSHRGLQLSHKSAFSV